MMKKLCLCVLVCGLVASMTAPLYAADLSVAAATTAATGSGVGKLALVSKLFATLKSYPYFTACVMIGAAIGILVEMNTTVRNKVFDTIKWIKQDKPVVAAAKVPAANQKK